MAQKVQRSIRRRESESVTLDLSFFVQIYFGHFAGGRSMPIGTEEVCFAYVSFLCFEMVFVVEIQCFVC